MKGFVKFVMSLAIEWFKNALQKKFLLRHY